MIAYIKGEVTQVDSSFIIVEAMGVGYELLCPNPFVFQKYKNSTATIYTYHYVREDAEHLYGFESLREKMLFSRLLQVSGIGPKGALAIVAASEVEEIASAIEREDDAFLTKFPGVGKKTARQMILDLKGKVQEWIPDGPEQITPTTNTSNQPLEEAMEALRSLGYTEKEIQKVQKQFKNEASKTPDEYIRLALAFMMKK